MQAVDLPFLWALLIAFAVLAYVCLDGFGLGVGILFPFFRRPGEQDRLMNSVAPIWDGNETWLVLGGGGLFAVFPLAYAVILPALYAPLTIMLLALVFRGVAFEFRWRTERGRFLWDLSFFAGSTTAAFCQGITLGAMVQGIPVADRAYAGGWWDWLTPFTVLTGVAVVVGYALLGATWLIMKTDGLVQAQARRFALPLGYATMGGIAFVSLCTPFLDPVYLQRWFGWPTLLFSLLVPALTLWTAWQLKQGLEANDEYRPFLAAEGLFALCFVGIGISFYPYVVPPSLTIWDVAAPDSSLEFLMVGTVVLIPLILLYTAYAYWVFRGKVKAGEGYH
jgi:cytochrome d ubiquinol oxidase subunit II